MTRRADPGDRRWVTLAPTATGRRRVDAARDQIRRALALVLASLPQSSLVAIGTGRELLAGQLAREAGPDGCARRVTTAQTRARKNPEVRP